MKFRSDDQRKAMFARLKGKGGGGGTPRPPRTGGGTPRPPAGGNGTPIPPRGGGPVNGGGNGSGNAGTPPNNGGVVYAPNTNHTNPTNYGPAPAFNSTNGVQWVFSTNLGFADVNDWKREVQSTHIAQFNLLNPLVGWNPTSWTQWLFEGTLFEKKKDGSGFMWFETSGINHDRAVSSNPKQR